MDCHAILNQCRRNLSATFGKRLRGTVLYGSEARGQAGPDSDIDLLVLLDGPVDHHQDSIACVHALYPLVLDLERPIHAEPVDAAEYEAQQWPLYRRARREGIMA